LTGKDKFKHTRIRLQLIPVYQLPSRLGEGYPMTAGSSVFSIFTLFPDHWKCFWEICPSATAKL